MFDSDITEAERGRGGHFFLQTEQLQGLGGGIETISFNFQNENGGAGVGERKPLQAFPLGSKRGSLNEQEGQFL